mgnify:CR=1 FL=1
MTSDVTSTAPKSRSDFRIFSGALAPFEGGDGLRRLRPLASSSVEDLGGDIVTHNALMKMAESAKGITIFRNHSYKVPDDILGICEGAHVKQAGMDVHGKPIYDMVMDVVIIEEPKAIETYDAVKQGVQLGTSIGAMIPKGSSSKNEHGGYTFEDLRLLEASIVGIPQNPRSWVQYATKAVKTGSVEDSEDTNQDFIVNEVDEPEMAATPEPEAAPEVEPEVEAEPEQTEEVEPDVSESTEPEVVKDDEGEEETPAQEAAEEDGDPEPAGDALEAILDETADGDDAGLGDDITRGIEALTGLLKDTTRELESVRMQVLDLTTGKSAIEAERDEALENLAVAKEIVERIANAPLGRRAVFRGAVSDFKERFGGSYNEDVLKMLENTDG